MCAARARLCVGLRICGFVPLARARARVYLRTRTCVCVCLRVSACVLSARVLNARVLNARVCVARACVCVGLRVCGFAGACLRARVCVCARSRVFCCFIVTFRFWGLFIDF